MSMGYRPPEQASAAFVPATNQTAKPKRWGCAKGCGLFILLMLILIGGGIWWTIHFVRAKLLAKTPLAPILTPLSDAQKKRAGLAIHPYEQAFQRAQKSGKPQEVTLVLDSGQLNELINQILIPPNRHSDYALVELKLDGDKSRLRESLSLPMKEGFYLNLDLAGRIQVSDFQWQVDPDHLIVSNWQIPVRGMKRDARERLNSRISERRNDENLPVLIKDYQVADSKAHLTLIVRRTPPQLNQ